MVMMQGFYVFLICLIIYINAGDGVYMAVVVGGVGVVIVSGD